MRRGTDRRRVWLIFVPDRAEHDVSASKPKHDTSTVPGYPEHDAQRAVPGQHQASSKSGCPAHIDIYTVKLLNKLSIIRHRLSL